MHCLSALALPFSKLCKELERFSRPIVDAGGPAEQPQKGKSYGRQKSTALVQERPHVDPESLCNKALVPQHQTLSCIQGAHVDAKIFSTSDVLANQRLLKPNCCEVEVRSSRGQDRCNLGLTHNGAETCKFP